MPTVRRTPPGLQPGSHHVSHHVSHIVPSCGTAAWVSGRRDSGDTGSSNDRRRLWHLLCPPGTSQWLQRRAVGLWNLLGPQWCAPRTPLGQGRLPEGLFFPGGGGASCLCSGFCHWFMAVALETTKFIKSQVSEFIFRAHAFREK